MRQVPKAETIPPPNSNATTPCQSHKTPAMVANGTRNTMPSSSLVMQINPSLVGPVFGGGALDGMEQHWPNDRSPVPLFPI